MIEFPAEVLRQAIRHCESTYPNEGCGAIAEVGGVLQVLPITNVLQRPSTGYLFDPHQQLGLMEALDREGGRIACVFHSHPDRSADFSGADRRAAVPFGQPTLPAVAYLVISVHSGFAREVRVHRLAGPNWESTDIHWPVEPASIRPPPPSPAD